MVTSWLPSSDIATASQRTEAVPGAAKPVATTVGLVGSTTLQTTSPASWLHPYTCVSVATNETRPLRPGSSLPMTRRGSTKVGTSSEHAIEGPSPPLLSSTASVVASEPLEPSLAPSPVPGVMLPSSPHAVRATTASHVIDLRQPRMQRQDEIEPFHRRRVQRRPRSLARAALHGQRSHVTFTSIALPGPTSHAVDVDDPSHAASNTCDSKNELRPGTESTRAFE